MCIRDRDIDILIVCSKLLTGFDAPICQVLYIDKELKEHGLFVRRVDTKRLFAIIPILLNRGRARIFLQR